MEPDNVTPLSKNPTSRFLRKLFNDQAGYIYVATKEPVSKDWERFFYSWPEQELDIVAFVKEASPKKEVYISPSLFSKPSSSKEDWYGTFHVWAEFDNGVPKGSELANYGVPAPTIKIRTSDPGHEHWYWKLDQFVTDPDIIESITSRITYTFGADLSGWDCVQVLRPPKTKHHESGKEVQLLHWTESTVNPLVFNELPAIPEHVSNVEFDTSSSVDVRDVMLKYPFHEKMRKLYMSQVEPGNGGKSGRSEKLCELAIWCLETGMAPVEALAILYNADERWGKFKNRRDREKRLIGIIKFALTKLPPTEQNEWAQFGGKLPVFGFKSFLEQEIKVEWVIENLIPKQGIMVIAAPSDSGKTVETLQLCIDLALGRKHHIWEVTRPFKIAFLSMELSVAMLYKRLQDMQNFTEEEVEVLEENFKIIPLGHGLNIGSPKDQAVIIEMIESHNPDGIFLDSLGAAYGGDMKDEMIRHVFEFLKRAITIKHDCFAWFIHHMTKLEGGKRPTIDDMYGSVYIRNYASAVIGMWRKNTANQEVSIFSLKSWFSAPFKEFKAKFKVDPLRLEIVDENEIPEGLFLKTRNDTEETEDDFSL